MPDLFAVASGNIVNFTIAYGALLLLVLRLITFTVLVITFFVAAGGLICNFDRYGGSTNIGRTELFLWAFYTPPR